MFSQIIKYRFTISIISLIIYYSVGITLLITSDNKYEIINLTPFTLLFTMLILLINHTHWKPSLAIALLVIMILGFVVELIGIKTGFPFGFYSYSTVLGPQIGNTPLIMGVNWGMLVYAGTLFFHSKAIPNWLKPIFTGLLLVILDIFLEPFAIKWSLWTWYETVPPFQNYLSWTIIAIFFSWLLSRFITKPMNNKIAAFVLIIQFLFFVILSK